MEPDRRHVRGTGRAGHAGTGRAPRLRRHRHDGEDRAVGDLRVADGDHGGVRSQTSRQSPPSWRRRAIMSRGSPSGGGSTVPPGSCQRPGNVVQDAIRPTSSRPSSEGCATDTNRDGSRTVAPGSPRGTKCRYVARTQVRTRPSRSSGVRFVHPATGPSNRAGLARTAASQASSMAPRSRGDSRGGGASGSRSRPASKRPTPGPYPAIPGQLGPTRRNVRFTWAVAREGSPPT